MSRRFYDYVIWGPIGRAFRANKKVVLLLDEIDKTESDVQDNLLDILEECQFTIRETLTTPSRRTRTARDFRHVQREARALRSLLCVAATATTSPSPRGKTCANIVEPPLPATSPKLLEAAINIFYELRDRGFEKPPATSELLDWIGALEATGQVPNPEMPPLTGALLKRAGDILRYRGGESKSRGTRY